MTTITMDSEARNPRQARRLCNFRDRHSTSLGCTLCHDQPICGGLQTEGALWNCLDLCCGDPKSCDAVCPNKPKEFADRVREIGGFSFDNVPRAQLLEAPNLPALVPTFYHGKMRRESFRGTSAVCLPFYGVIPRNDGSARYTSAQSLASGFGIATQTNIILTGTEKDAPLERWWSLGSRRRDAIRALLELKVSMVTAPNFSLFTDQPRWDDMHSMKRIALVHEEFLSEGLPAALHVNARTEKDWERWSEFINERSEITHVAYEFGTGAGKGARIDWHAKQLGMLASTVDRPLHLVVRGGVKVLPLLIKSFAGITILESSVFMKTIYRKRAKPTAEGTVEWVSCPTRTREMLDSLLAHNWRIVEESYRGRFGDLLPRLEAAG